MADAPGPDREPPTPPGVARQFVHFFASTQPFPSRRGDGQRCECGGTDWGTAKAWWRERLRLIQDRVHLTLDSGRAVPTGQIEYTHCARP